MRSATLMPRSPLPAADFEARHRGLLWLLAAHLVVLPAFGLSQGWSLRAGLLLDLVPLALGLLALAPWRHRDVRASFAVLGLLSCSAVLVWLWHGQIEAHFHYFVVVGAVALYESAIPYAIAFLFVILQHGAMSAWMPHKVYDHMSGMTHPWAWAAIHGGFIAALAAANLVAWRASAAVRAREAAAAERALAGKRRFERAFRDAPNGTALLDAGGVVVEVNAALAAATRRPVEELCGASWLQLLPPEDRDAVAATWPPGPEDPERELRVLRGDGTVGWMLWKHSPIEEDVDAAARWISQTVDVSRRKEAEASLEFQADHDGLTGLPNRTAFHRLAQAAIDGAGPHQRVAVLFADVDDFKVVNDSLGHAAGDALLTGVVERLRAVLRPEDVMGRFGGDELVVCVPDTDEPGAAAVAERLSRALKCPFEVGEVQRPVTASIGFALSGPGTATVDLLLRNADVAMYAAKAAGKARWCAFDAEMQDGAIARLQLEADLRKAVEHGHIGVHYQPQVRPQDGRPVGVEALARWTHPVRGRVSPGVFIPIAESSGLVGQIGGQVMRQACLQLKRWDAEHPELAGLTVSVNLSPRCICDEDVPGVVAAILAETGLDPARLCVEVTESAVVGRGDRPVQVIRALKALGVRLAIDDFGVGASSLSQLARLRPLDELKIDKSFVDDLDTPDGVVHATLVEAILGVSAAGRVHVVVEGVERPTQLQRLLELGSPTIQGYLFSPPLPAAEALDYLVDAMGAAPAAATG